MSNWDDRLDAWQTELDLLAQLEGSEWVSLDRASERTGVSRAALRSWYRDGRIPSRVVDGPHGPQRLVPMGAVAAKAEQSPRIRRKAQRQLDTEVQLELLRRRVDTLEVRLAALEGRSG